MLWALSWNNQNYSLLVRVKLPPGNQSVVQGWDVFLVKVGKQIESEMSQKIKFPKIP